MRLPSTLRGYSWTPWQAAHSTQVDPSGAELTCLNNRHAFFFWWREQGLLPGKRTQGGWDWLLANFTVKNIIAPDRGLLSRLRLVHALTSSQQGALSLPGTATEYTIITCTQPVAERHSLHTKLPSTP
jgi:hypothetical protein